MRPADLTHNIRFHVKTVKRKPAGTQLRQWCRWTFFVSILLLQSIQAAEGGVGGFAVQAGVVFFDKASGLSSAPAIALRGFYRAPGLFGAYLETGRSFSANRFDIIGGSQSNDVHWDYLIAGLRIRGWQLPFGFSSGVTAAAGAVRISVAAFEISLGAAGSLRIPQAREIKAVYQIGGDLGRYIGKRLFFTIEPAIQIVSLSGIKTNVQLQGGLGFVFN